MRWLPSLLGLGLLAAGALSVAAPVRAGDAVVVEFFTSQGCSSCPPADEIFSQIADRPGVVALALHVDYWDYLGWKDTFGQPGNTARQRAYAKAHDARTIYTPQMIVAGQDVVIGHDREALEARIAAHAEEPARANLTVRRDGPRLEVRVAPAGDPAGPAEVYLVEFIPSATVEIKAGENAGLTHAFSNVVTAWITLGRWDGRAPAEYDHAVDPATPQARYAVIVQAVRLGPVLAAALP